jgi:hypothetical protein
MKTKIDNYIFDKTAKTITFTDYTSIRLDAILLITNVTDGLILYNFADPTKGGTVLSNVLTLVYDTSAMSNTDKLLIYYDDSTTELATDESIKLLRTIAKLLEPSSIQDIRQRQRVVLDGIGTGSSGVTTELAATLPVAATLASVTSIAGAQGPTTSFPTPVATLYQPVWEGPVDQRWRVMEDSHISYQLVRNKLTFN